MARGAGVDHGKLIGRSFELIFGRPAPYTVGDDKLVPRKARVLQELPEHLPGPTLKGSASLGLLLTERLTQQQDAQTSPFGLIRAHKPLPRIGRTPLAGGWLSERTHRLGRRLDEGLDARP